MTSSRTSSMVLMLCLLLMEAVSQFPDVDTIREEINRAEMGLAPRQVCSDKMLSHLLEKLNLEKKIDRILESLEARFAALGDRMESIIRDEVNRTLIAAYVLCPNDIGPETSCARLMKGSCHCVTKTKRNFHDSRAFCRSKGMDLVAFETREEEMAIEKKWTNDDLKFRYWTSGSDNEVEGSWVWTATGDPISYKNWASGQTDNGGQKQHYLVKNYGGSTWDDDYSTHEFGAICETLPLP